MKFFAAVALFSSETLAGKIYIYITCRENSNCSYNDDKLFKNIHFRLRQWQWVVMILIEHAKFCSKNSANVKGSFVLIFRSENFWQKTFELLSHWAHVLIIFFSTKSLRFFLSVTWSKFSSTRFTTLSFRGLSIKSNSQVYPSNPDK